jgi:hypothetical protein
MNHTGLKMSNNQYKKSEAQKHNAARIEAQAYEEDRIRQPEKYKNTTNASDYARARSWAAISMGMGR